MRNNWCRNSRVLWRKHSCRIYGYFLNTKRFWRLLFVIIFHMKKHFKKVFFNRSFTCSMLDYSIIWGTATWPYAMIIFLSIQLGWSHHPNSFITEQIWSTSSLSKFYSCFSFVYIPSCKIQNILSKPLPNKRGIPIPPHSTQNPNEIC
jgi:hypothetical protein